MLQNPFTKRKMILDKTYFYGRREELHQAIDHIRSGECCSVIGEPKIGKSSLLWRLHDVNTLREMSIDPREYVVVYFDFQLDLGITQQVLWQTLLAELASKVTDEELCEEVSRICRKSDISFGTLRAVLRKITRRPYKVVFLFDEFDYVAQNRKVFDVAFQSGLRSLANNLGIVYVTASRLSLHELLPQDPGFPSPFFNIFMPIRLRLLGEGEAIDLILQANRPVEPSLSAEADYILRKAGRHPFVLQILCYHLFNFKTAKGILTEDDLEKAVRRSNDQLLPFFENIWCEMEHSQRRALRAVAGLAPASSIDHTILRGLERQGYVVFEDDDTSLFCELFEDFVRARSEEISGVETPTSQVTELPSSGQRLDTTDTVAPIDTLADAPEATIRGLAPPKKALGQEKSRVGISSALHSKLRRALLDCGSLASNDQLSAVFAHPLLKPWRNNVPQVPNRATRADAVIAFLVEKRRADTKENALVLLLRVLSERLDPADECHPRLARLADELEPALGGGASTPYPDTTTQPTEPKPASQAPRLDTLKTEPPQPSPEESQEKPREEAEKRDFFVSYNRANKQWAEWIAWHLEEAGYTTVIQTWDFRPGSNFVIEMQRAAEQARRTIAVLSPDYLQALYTQPEWAAAFAQDPTGEKGTLLPVRVQECELKGMLSQVVYIDLVSLTEQAAKETLLAGVKQGRVKPTTAPGFPGAVKRIISEQPGFPGESSLD